MAKSGMYRLLFLAMLLSVNFVAQAQESVDAIEMADPMRESGKIYVVVGVLLIIFLGFTAFLVITDKKISNLEKELEGKE